MKTIIVIPSYNEAQNIERLIKEILTLPVSDLNLVIVDDNSPDGTAQIVENIKNSLPETRKAVACGRFGKD